SPFFARFLQGKSTNEQEFVIHSVSLQAFAALLNILNGVNNSISEENVESLLHVAERFHFQVITDVAEEFLMNSEKCSVHRKMRIADSYKLTKIMVSLLPLYSKGRLIVELIDSGEFSLLSEDLKATLLLNHKKAAMGENEKKKTIRKRKLAALIDCNNNKRTRQ
ncbi:hypothetical protein PFISCL1PPCAC_15944, partial [Pristionchus fissidentatus]